VMLLIYDEFGYSFKKIARLVEDGLHSIGYTVVQKVGGHTAISIPKNYKSIIMTDIILAVRWGWIRRFLPFTDKLCLWCDTPLSLEHIANEVDFINENTCNYVVLPYFYYVFRKYGIRVDGYIPRPIDVDTANKVYESASCDDLIKKYGEYVITVGGDQVIAPPKLPRKGLDMYDRLCEWLKSKYGLNCLAVSNWIFFKNVHRIPFGSLSEYELMRLIKCAKLFVWCSRAEGFGMPPLEAMAVGQLVVASNNPTNELIRGVKFDYTSVVKVYMPEIGYYYYAYDYRFEDLKDAVDYALSLPEDERYRITREAREAAKLYHPRYVSQLLVEV